MAKKKWKLVGPGKLLDRKVHAGVLDVGFDPSPDGFITDSRGRKERLKVTIIPDDGDIDPIEVEASAGVWKFKLNETCVPRERVADLDALVSGERPVTIMMEYQRDEDLLDVADGKASANAGGKPPKAGSDSDFDEDPDPTKDSKLKTQNPVAPATGIHNPLCIPIRSKKIALDATIALNHTEGGWKLAYMISAGRKDAKLLPDASTVVYLTSQAAAEAGCKELVAWLNALSEKEYAYVGAAQVRIKKVIAKWIDAAPEA